MCYSFIHNKKRYEYTLSQPFEDEGEQVIEFSCPKLGMNQVFLVEDIPNLILDLPNIAQNIQDYHAEYRQRQKIQFRVSEQDRQKIEAKAKAQGFSSISAFARNRLLETS